MSMPPRLNQTGTGGEGDLPALAHLRFLKWLVGGLAVVMGVGILAITALLWMRLSAPVLPDLPEALVLPDGEQAEAVTFAQDYIVVVTQSGAVHVFDRAGRARGRIDLP